MWLHSAHAAPTETEGRAQRERRGESGARGRVRFPKVAVKHTKFGDWTKFYHVGHTHNVQLLRHATVPSPVPHRLPHCASESTPHISHLFSPLTPAAHARYPIGPNPRSIRSRDAASPRSRVGSQFGSWWLRLCQNTVVTHSIAEGVVTLGSWWLRLRVTTRGVATRVWWLHGSGGLLLVAVTLLTLLMVLFFFEKLCQLERRSSPCFSSASFFS